MPTNKQVRDHYKRIRYHLYHLQKALNEAHSKDVLVYQDYLNESPCHSLSQVKERVQLTTKDARAKVVENEVLKQLKGYY